MPRVGDSLLRQSSRKISEQLRAPVRERSISQGHKCIRSVPVEVALRHGRVRVSLAPQVTSDISAIFEEQSVRLVLRMTLEKDEQALSLLSESVDTPILGAREDAIAASR
jgi:hypothetical protein